MNASEDTLNRVHGGKVYETARALGVAPEEILDFSASINPLGPPPGLKEHLFQRFGRVVHYPEMGAETLARALAERWGLEEGSVLVGNGSTSFLYLLPQTWAPAAIRIAAPAFGEYENAALLAQCPTEHVLPRGGPPWPYTRRDRDMLLEPGVGSVWIANPANPTGQLIPKASLLDLAARAEESDVRVVVDEAFVEFCPEESLVREATGSRNLIVLRSMTKIFALPGLRLGWMAAHPEVIRRLAPRMQPWTVSNFAQEAGFFCLEQDAYVAETLELIRRERDWLARRLETLGFLTPYPSAANYILARIEVPGWDAPRLARELERQKILVRDCSSFWGVGSRFVRMAVRLRHENEALVDALARVFGG